MTARQANITKTEISRTVKGITEAGILVGRVEVDHVRGTVVVWPIDAAGTNATGIDAMAEGFK